MITMKLLAFNNDHNKRGRGPGPISVMNACPVTSPMWDGGGQGKEGEDVGDETEEEGEKKINQFHFI